MALVFQQIIQLLSSIGIAAYGLGYLLHSLMEIPWGAICGWFHAAPMVQITPQLDLTNQALFTQFQQLMDMQFQIDELRRISLALPALPNEGF